MTKLSPESAQHMSFLELGLPPSGPSISGSLYHQEGLLVLLVLKNREELHAFFAVGVSAATQTPVGFYLQLTPEL